MYIYIATYIKIKNLKVSRDQSFSAIKSKETRKILAYIVRRVIKSGTPYFSCQSLLLSNYCT